MFGRLDDLIDSLYSPKAIFISIVIMGSCSALAGIFLTTDINNSNKIPAGTLLNLTTESGWFQDSSILYLTDGSVITVSGSVSKWRKGMDVTHPAPDGSTPDDYDNYWCLDNTCLKQE
ncbi:hypothetical protein [Kosakonia radicincitans]|uniref:hypothetical protein n=1 Tax=Kosakonia radicincitans TaxID=283686 RepID=UPI0008C9B362|nr:hypothetical protein [Kosakonia radicincitans]SET70833.1 hypothetical protein SAMN03159294_0036 [Kosakonia radicincitans]